MTKSNLEFGQLTTSSYKNQHKHPYVQNDFKGTKAIQEYRKLMEQGIQDTDTYQSIFKEEK